MQLSRARFLSSALTTFPCGVKIDSVACLFPRHDGASSSFASDVISIRHKAAAELFGELSKADFIAFFDKDLFALVGARRYTLTCQRAGLL